ncbi:MAG: ABC transporter ATP-binding protein [Motiliproteus sp.]
MSAKTIPEIVPEAIAETNAAAEKLLVLKNLHKNFDVGSRSQTVLKGVDLTLSPGEVLVLLGASGSGKSTLLNLIAGLEYPDQGTVTIAGKSITELSEHQRTLFRRQHIGIVFQFFNLIPSLTVMENLLLPLQLNRMCQDQQPIRELLGQLGLLHIEDLYPEQLSGGEQQRVAIARALVHQPSLLLADEPTGSLDNSNAEKVSRLLFDQVRQRQQSLILVTHNERLAAHGDRVLRLNQGQVETEQAANQDAGL